jgi:hypothetical protein
MHGPAQGILRIFLWGICAFHIVIGAGVNVSAPFVEQAAAMYGATVELTPQFLAILHPLGAFMFILGVMAATAAINPHQYRAVVYGFALLFVIRGLQRIVFKQQIEEAFHIDATRNLLAMAFFLAMGIVLGALQWYVETQRNPATRTT